MNYPSEGNLQRAIAFVAALGIGVAAYIAIAEANGGSPVCLAGGSGCETVAKSSWSHLAGADVAVLGVVGYALLLAMAFFANDLTRFAGFALALGGLGYSVFLTYVELFKIEAVCQWCLASATLMTVLFLLCATRLIAYAGTAGAVRERA
jgi:uncharacterized membrane protein